MAESVFDEVFATLFETKPRHRPQGAGRRSRIDELTNKYLQELKDNLSPDDVRSELRSVFKHIRDECEAYGRGKAHIRMNILRIVNALDQGINAKRGEYLLAKWQGWEDMLNPACANYIGINLPGSMILEGYLVFEDLITIREHFSQKFEDGSFEPRIHN